MQYIVELITYHTVQANSEEEAYKVAREQTSIDELSGSFRVPIEIEGEIEDVAITRDKTCDTCYPEYSENGHRAYCSIFEQLQEYKEFDATQELTGCSRHISDKFLRNIKARLSKKGE